MKSNKSDQEKRTLKEIAIGYLYQIHDDLNPPHGHDLAEPPWLANAQDYVLKYLGPNSNLYKLMIDFKFPNRETDPKKFGNSVFQAQTMVKRCITYIERFDLYKEPKVNFIYRARGTNLATLIGAVLLTVFSAGTIVGKALSDYQNTQLKIKVESLEKTEKLLKDSILKNKRQMNSRPMPLRFDTARKDTT